MVILSICFGALITYICGVSTIPLATLYSQNNKYIVPLELSPLLTCMPSSIKNNLLPIKFPLIPQNISDPQTRIRQLIQDYINETISNPFQYPHLYA